MAEGKHLKSSFEVITGTKQSKKLQSRVTYVENGMKDLADTLLEYTSKCSSIRDKMDDVGKSLATFAQYEPYNTTSKLGMIASSEALCLAGNFRNAQMRNFQQKIVPTLSYENMCKNLREVLRASKNANEREKKLHEKNIRLQNNSLLDNAEIELQKLHVESTKLTVAAHEQMIEFEQKRCRDVKQILLSFFKHEITCLCNSLELFSEACSYITSIDEEADMQAIKSGMVLRGIQPLFGPNHHMRSKERKKFTISQNLNGKKHGKERGESLVPNKNLIRAESLSKTLFSDDICDVIYHQKQHIKSKEMTRKTSENSQGSSEKVTYDTKVDTDDENGTDDKEDKRVSFDLEPCETNSAKTSRRYKDQISKPTRKHSLKDSSSFKEKSKKRTSTADVQ